MKSAILLFFFCIQQGSSFLTAREGDCICPGHEVVFECTTTGGVATVWRGSIFNCAGMTNSVSLRHSQFSNNETVVGVCNDGIIKAHGISVSGNNYTSQLNITIDESMLGQTIECAHDDGRSENVIGQKVLTLDEDSLNLSSYIHLSNVHPNMMTFTLGSVANICPSSSLLYQIETDCGIICPENTTVATITCFRVTTIVSNECWFSVRASTMCGSNTTIMGTESSIPLRLRLSGTPVVQAIPYYSHSNQHLTLIHTTFNKTENFTVTDNIDGSATTYTINYHDIVTNKICSSVVIPASLCDEGTCSHTFEISTSLCLLITVINVTVFATNVLGNGPTSIPRIIECSHSHVDMDITKNMIRCVLVESYAVDNNLSCIIQAIKQGSCSSYQVESPNYVNGISSNVSIAHLPRNEIFCFVVETKNLTSTVIFMGSFSTSTEAIHQQTMYTAIILSVIAVLTAILTVVVSVIVVYIILKRKQVRKSIVVTDVSGAASKSLQNKIMVCICGCTKVSTEDQMNQREVIYADVHVVTTESRMVEIVLDDDRVEYTELNHNIKAPTSMAGSRNLKKDKATTENLSHMTSCNLDNLLIQLRSEVTPYWFQFGTVSGMDEATLERYSKYPPEQCLIEVIDYWVRIHDNKPTWRAVADVLKEIKINKLAEDILKVYETGKLPIEASDTVTVPRPSAYEEDEEIPPPLPPKA